MEELEFGDFAVDQLENEWLVIDEGHHIVKYPIVAIKVSEPRVQGFFSVKGIGLDDDIVLTKKKQGSQQGKAFEEILEREADVFVGQSPARRRNGTFSDEFICYLKSRMERPINRNVDSQLTITHELQVKLVHITPASLPGRVARGCYGKRPDEPNDHHDRQLTHNLLGVGHHEPLECSLVVFQCLLPKFVCSQLNRHRIGIGRCQQSFRLSFAKPMFFWPKDVVLLKDSEDRFKADAELIERLRTNKARKREREILQRHVSDHVIVEYCTWFNMRQWLSLAQKRLADDAQEETQRTVSMMQGAIMATDWAEVLG